jgi:hypothetical protein
MPDHRSCRVGTLKHQGAFVPTVRPGGRAPFSARVPGCVENPSLSEKAPGIPVTLADLVEKPGQEATGR